MMELQNHNFSSINNTIDNISNQESYAQEDLSFEADQDNHNSSTSSDRFATPSAKFFYEQYSNKKQISENVRQTLFQNFEPLNESNNNLHNSKIDCNNLSSDTICVDKIDKNLTNDSMNFTNKTFQDNTVVFNDHAMDLSSSKTSHYNIDQNGQSDQNNQYIADLSEKDEKINQLTKYVNELNRLNKVLSEAIVSIQDHFELSLNKKNATIQELNLQNNVIAKEKKLALEDVQGLETSFSELHRRYEKLKLTLESCKKKEQLFENECLVFSVKLNECQKLNEEYKSQLEKVEEEKNSIYETFKKQNDKELISLRAQLKKTEMRLNGLQSQLDQKTIENLELNKIVDELTK